MATQTSGRRQLPRSGRGVRLARLLGLAAVLLLVASACSNIIGSDDSDTATADSSSTTSSSVIDDGPGASSSTTEAASACPDVATSLDMVNQATYAVYGETIINTGGGPELVHFQIGTAWAAGRRLLVTNAHVTEAYADFAAEGIQLERAIAIQAGTGTVVTLLRELTHPDYDGDPLASPDVGLLTTQQELPVSLELADPDVEIALGDEIQIVGFPGDVTNFIEIVPNETVPQATSLNGEITALRTHDDTEAVTGENLDVIQHQAPTTPGTSGSSMVACGKVIGVNNAGTVNLIVTPQPDGSLVLDRQAAAANNFGVHVRHIDEMIGLFEDNAVQGSELPVEAVEAPVVDMPMDALTLVGSVADPYPHDLTLFVGDDGTITGTSDWAGNSFGLSGQLFEDGTFFFIDDAPEIDPEFRRGFYEGTVTSDTTIEGEYYEEGIEEEVAPFSAELQ